MQQLTKVIYHLNSKSEDASELGDQAASYENEIEGILRDAGERVKRFRGAACSLDSLFPTFVSPLHPAARKAADFPRFVDAREHAILLRRVEPAAAPSTPG